MSYRACRVADARGVHRFDWARLDGDDLGPAPPPGLPLRPPEMPAPPPADPQAHLAALERDAFAKGYAAGERAGLERSEERRVGRGASPIRAPSRASTGNG